jgi:tRNA-dihydrouridine synthase B
MMADAAEYNADKGAQIIDLNMGCPAKKICNVMAGSALLQNEKLVASILEAVVNRVAIPITLKIRTGWDKEQRNGIAIARIAEASGIQALAVHGRTRACAYRGDAEYDTIAAIKDAVNIPVIANGDITTPEKAKYVLDYTGADGIMIGRAAQGRPWIFREVQHYLDTGQRLQAPGPLEVRDTLLTHLDNLYHFYGEDTGVRVARKHIAWYSKGTVGGAAFRHHINRLDNVEEQRQAIFDFFARQIEQKRAAA